MLLQIALDLEAPDSVIEILRELGEHVDIVEIGTPCIMEYGIGVVKTVKNAFPAVTLLADLKIMDAGEHESQLAFKAGADIVTVLAAAEDETVAAVVRQAKSLDKRVMADMIGVRDFERRVREIDAMGVDYICAHTAFDLQRAGNDPLRQLALIKANARNAKTAVAGGICIENLEHILLLDPDIVIVGGGITGQGDRAATALRFKRELQGRT